MLRDVSLVNKVRPEDVLHVGFCAAFQSFRERHGFNPGLEYVASALLNPSSLFPGDPKAAGHASRFWFPTMNGPAATKMRMLKEILEDYTLNKYTSCKAPHNQMIRIAQAYCIFMHLQ